MTKKIRVNGTQAFNENGKIGVWLFVVSPIVSLGCYYWWLREIMKPYNSVPEVAAGIGAIAGIAFLCSIPLLIVGRTQNFKVDIEG